MKLYTRPFAVLFSVITLFGADISKAQSPVNSSEEIGQIEYRFKKQIPDLPDFPEESEDVIDNSEASVTGPTFMLREVIIRPLKQTGVEKLVYPQEKLQAIVNPYIGKEIAFSDAQDMANAIKSMYRRDGYFTSYVIIPEQIPNGSLLIEVIEGYIERVIFEADVLDVRPDIMRSLERRLMQEKPFKRQSVETFKSIVQELAGTQISFNIKKAASGAIGGSDVHIINESFDFYAGSISFNNQGTDSIGPHQAIISNQFNSLLGLYEKTTATIAVAEDTDELLYINIGQSHLLNAEGTNLSLTTSKSKSEPDSELSGVEIHSVSHSAGSSLSHPFINLEREKLTAVIAYDYDSSKTKLLDVTDSYDRLHTATATVSYSRQVERLYNSISASSRIGLDIFDSIDEDSDLKTREDAEVDSITLLFSSLHLYKFEEKIGLQLATKGQWSPGGLFSSQEIGLGGSSFGRGYDSSEISGDSGLAAQLELQYSLEWVPFTQGVKAYYFWDIGKVWDHTSLNEQKKDHSLSSMGLGSSVNITEQLSGNVMFAKPLTRLVANENNRDPRLVFSLNMKF